MLLAVLQWCLQMNLVLGVAPADMSSKSPYWNQSSCPQEVSSRTPIFLTTLSRHGSRTASSEENYLNVQNYIAEAQSLNMLTKTGKNALLWSHQLYNELSSNSTNWGGLTAVGRNEQYDIGYRTFDRFRSLFSSSETIVIVDSTIVQDYRDSYLSQLIIEVVQ